MVIEIKETKIEDKLNELFIKLVDETSPEYALGILESIKGAYFMVCIKKYMNER